MGNIELCRCLRKEEDQNQEDNTELKTEKNDNKKNVLNLDKTADTFSTNFNQNLTTKENLLISQENKKENTECSFSQNIKTNSSLNHSDSPDRERYSDKIESSRSNFDPNKLHNNNNTNNNTNNINIVENNLTPYSNSDDTSPTNKNSNKNLHINNNNEFSEPPTLKASKKQLMYINMGNNPPLEVINELNTESFNESLRISGEKKKKTEMRNNIDDLKIELLADFERKDTTTGNMKNSIKIERNSQLHQNNKSGSFKKNENSINNNNDINDAWKNLLITNVIPEKKLLSDFDDEIMYQGIVQKFTAGANKNSKATYIDKFCLLTKREFKCYKSKETFLKLQNPSYRINLENIAYAKRLFIPNANNTSTFGKKNGNVKNYFYFYIQIMDPSEESLIKQYTWSSEDESGSPSPRSARKSKIILFLKLFFSKF